MTVCNFFYLDFGRDTDLYPCILDFRDVRIFSCPGRDEFLEGFLTLLSYQMHEL
jgi:hypothetical protein